MRPPEDSPTVSPTNNSQQSLPENTEPKLLFSQDLTDEMKQNIALAIETKVKNNKDVTAESKQTLMHESEHFKDIDLKPIPGNLTNAATLYMRNNKPC